MDRAQAGRTLCEQLREAKDIRARCRSNHRAQRALIRGATRARLARIHQSALDNPATALACAFFLDEIYPAQAQPWRDSQALRALPSLCRLLPESALIALGAAAELDAISEGCDLQGCQWIGSQEAAGERAASSPLDEREALLCFSMPGRAPRERQVELMVQAGMALRELAGSALAKKALSAMRLPAMLAGLSDLQGFLERGLVAFEALRDPAAFCQGLAWRERADLELVFGIAPGEQGAASQTLPQSRAPNQAGPSPVDSP